MWEVICELFAANFDKIFFSFITIVIVSAAIMDIRDKNYPPGPMGLPLFGYLPFLNSKAPYLTLAELAQQYGRVYSIQLGSIYTVVVTDVKLIRQALSQEAFNGRAPLFLTQGVMKGKGLFCSEGELWKEHRRFVETTMKNMAIPKRGSQKTLMEERISACVKDFIKEAKINSGREQDIVPSLRHNVGALIMEIVMGSRLEKEDPIWVELQNLLEEGFKVMAIAGNLNFLPWLRRFSKYTKLMNCILDGKQKSHKVYQDLTDKQAKHGVDNNNIRSVVDAYIIELKGRDGKENGSFTRDQINHVLSDLVSAGWDKTLTSLKWLYLYMGIYPDVQEKVAKELERVVGRGKDVTVENFNNLQYTQAVIMEVWRHRTIVPLGIPHGTTERTKIGDYWIPKGSMVLPLLWAVHRDTRLWDRPDDFVPERHLFDDGSVRYTENLIPFQTGKRVCIGEEMGRNIVQLFFSNVVNNFKISLPKGYKINHDDLPDCGVTLAPKPGQLVLDTRR